MIRAEIAALSKAGVPQRESCAAIGIDARTLQRWERRGADGVDGRGKQARRTASGHQLSPAEEAELLATLNSEPYRDLPPEAVVALLADQGRYLASASTMYRLLRRQKQLAHRTATRPPVRRAKPREARATAPNQVWSWDITYLKTDIRGLFLRLYVVMDVFSRKIVGWAVHHEETSEHAAALLAEIVAREGVRAGCILHSDNGAPMKGATMIATLERLGVLPSFSRARVSNDNPYSEALFRTLKYCPQYPADGVFVDLAAAEAWTTAFVRWYNETHRHSGIKYVTPSQRHAGLDTAILAARANVYAAARAENPLRWTTVTRDWSPITEIRLNPDADPEMSAA